jgi:Uma2 family endonuclease
MPATALVTSEQYLALPDEFDQNGNRIKDELIGGEIVRMPPASLLHDRVKSLITRILGRYLDATPQASLELLIEAGAEVGKYDTFVPDLGIVRIGSLSGEARILRGAPDLAVEVVSPSDRPATLKKKINSYLKGGSQSVWVIYPKTRSVIIHSADTVVELEGNQRVQDPLLPGFSLPVSEFFKLP